MFITYIDFKLKYGTTNVDPAPAIPELVDIPRDGSVYNCMYQGVFVQAWYRADYEVFEFSEEGAGTYQTIPAPPIDPPEPEPLSIVDYEAKPGKIVITTMGGEEYEIESGETLNIQEIGTVNAPDPTVGDLVEDFWSSSEEDGLFD